MQHNVSWPVRPGKYSELKSRLRSSRTVKVFFNAFEAVRQDTQLATEKSKRELKNQRSQQRYSQVRFRQSPVVKNRQRGWYTGRQKYRQRYKRDLA